MDNFCYIVGCHKTRKAMVIDPGPEVERIMAVARKENLDIVTIVNTHGHGDHTAGNSKLKDLAGGDRPALGKSIRRLMELPDQTVVWPGHNYGPTSSSTIGWERRNNVNAKEYGYYVDD